MSALSRLKKADLRKANAIVRRAEREDEVDVEKLARRELKNLQK